MDVSATVQIGKECLSMGFGIESFFWMDVSDCHSPPTMLLTWCGVTSIPRLCRSSVAQDGIVERCLVVAVT